MRSIHHRLVLSLALFAGCGSVAAASLPSTGLGQAWPNTVDLSTSSHYHVYLFQRSGVRYLQVNDGSGVVRGAIAVIDGEAVDLPIGVDADRWSTITHNQVSTAGETVYRDAALTVLVSPQPNGTARLMVAPVECDNPAQCSIRGP